MASLSSICRTPTRHVTKHRRAMSSLTVAPGETRIGWIGTGVMGRSMVGHLVEECYEVNAYTRTPSKAEGIGVNIVKSPAEVARSSDIVFMIVGYPHDVEEVCLGDSGLLNVMKEGSILVDCTTSEPSLASHMSGIGKERGIAVIDAPCSGGDIGARNGTLTFMCGSDSEDAFTTVTPLLEIMGQNFRHMGPSGAGQHTKAVNQILIATNMIGCVEGLLYAGRAGLDLDEAIAAVGYGAAGSWSILNLGPRIVKGDFAPGFFVEHFLKDLGIAMRGAKEMGLDLPGLGLASSLYERVMEMGHEKSGTQALYLALEDMNKESK